MKSRRYKPLNKSELARALGVQSDERSQMRATLNKMERKGELILGKKSRYSLKFKKATKGGEMTGSVGR